MGNETGGKEISKWEKRSDNLLWLFTMCMVIGYGLYTVWGVVELVTSKPSPLVGEATAAKKEAPPLKTNYWDGWTKGKAQGPMPDCNVNVLALGGDDILQATVDIYCGVKPGSYTSKINPKAMDTYNARGTNYPDGKTGVLIFKDIGVVFTTEHKNGQPIYDVLTIAHEKSVASKDAGHPLNPATCEKCHAEFGGTCVGFVCGNRFF